MFSSDLYMSPFLSLIERCEGGLHLHCHCGQSLRVVSRHLEHAIHYHTEATPNYWLLCRVDSFNCLAALQTFSLPPYCIAHTLLSPLLPLLQPIRNSLRWSLPLTFVTCVVNAVNISFPIRIMHTHCHWLYYCIYHIHGKSLPVPSIDHALKLKQIFGCQEVS